MAEIYNTVDREANPNESRQHVCYKLRRRLHLPTPHVRAREMVEVKECVSARRGGQRVQMGHTPHSLAITDRFTWLHSVDALVSDARHPAHVIETNDDAQRR